MPWDKEKRKQYNKEYYQKNKDKAKQNSKEYREKPENKEKYKQYQQTEQRKKSHRICQWKQQGIITDDYDALYEKYINTKNCELCNVVLTTDRYNTPTTRCMDHDHDITDRDNVRNIVCHSCNSKLPKQ
tara:strand:+ start:296 stop:682 length:387 start_codon:yes stop_codon:yes gene_type:complete